MKLLVVTSQLLDSVVPNATTTVQNVAASLGWDCCLLSSTQATTGAPWTTVQEKLSTSYQGVVLVGGPNVVPSERRDSLRDLPEVSTTDRNNDPDDLFYVWNDDAYGTFAGATFPALPVSRIPLSPGATADDIQHALRPRPRVTNGSIPAPNTGLAAQQFSTWSTAVAQKRLGKKVLSSGPIATGQYKIDAAGNATIDGEALYLVLHGFPSPRVDFEGTNAVEAMQLSDLDGANPGVVFCAACYGGQIATVTALAATTLLVNARSTAIALTLLGLGATAFVGSTAVHYFPTDSSDDGWARPLHDAFWAALPTLGPAKALLAAKFSQKAWIASHAQRYDNGRQYLRYQDTKMIWTFTCLGLGWWQ
jgi:hypothetical protein